MAHHGLALPEKPADQREARQAGGDGRAQRAGEARGSALAGGRRGLASRQGGSRGGRAGAASLTALARRVGSMRRHQGVRALAAAGAAAARAAAPAAWASGSGSSGLAFCPGLHVRRRGRGSGSGVQLSAFAHSRAIASSSKGSAGGGAATARLSGTGVSSASAAICGSGVTNHCVEQAAQRTFRPPSPNFAASILYPGRAGGAHNEHVESVRGLAASSGVQAALGPVMVNGW